MKKKFVLFVGSLAFSSVSAQAQVPGVYFPGPSVFISFTGITPTAGPLRTDAAGQFIFDEQLFPAEIAAKPVIQGFTDTFDLGVLKYDTVFANQNRSFTIERQYIQGENTHTVIISGANYLGGWNGAQCWWSGCEQWGAANASIVFGMIPVNGAAHSINGYYNFYDPWSSRIQIDGGTPIGPIQVIGIGGAFQPNTRTDITTGGTQVYYEGLDSPAIGSYWDQMLSATVGGTHFALWQSWDTGLPVRLNLFQGGGVSTYSRNVGGYDQFIGFGFPNTPQDYGFGGFSPP